ncbi:hypothetical protein Bca52824_028616 [Brassica carinata]|uniref:Disease resistance R13L4/SHOC-2-like LRR domain-containing protein n=1 Tax=Brassica carinata TaxID=52824 RepID=A0A8X7VCI5_BRACI|nr:hypothetical protein Bca52824_028616 [Brassica carinata]
MSESRLHFHFLSLILLCCVSPSSFYTFTYDSTSYVACHPNQTQALTEFMNEFDSSQCYLSDPSNGVWCDKSTGAVTMLRLQACLSGTLKPNSSLFRLHHLRHLVLYQNNFLSSSLPLEFGNLSRLEVLYLANNSFVGQGPSSFNNLSLLTYLVLSLNKLTGSFPLLRNLSKLSVLDLSNNHFSGTLNPSNTGLFELRHLSYLGLGCNNFSSSLPSEFGNLNRLEFLNLSSNGFSGQVPSSLNNLSLLSILSLSQNELTGGLPLLRNLSKLSFLSLSHNHFTGTLNPNSTRLFELHHLRYLDLSSNNFSSSIPSEIGNLNRLEVLALSSNDFFGQVPPTISNLTSLTQLYLEDNQLTGSFPLVQNLTMLSVLSLYGNHFSGTIPSSLVNMPFLSILDLRGNDLTGSIEFPNSSTLSMLESLYLGNNHFEGKIIEPISKLINLTHLGLSFLNTSYPIDVSLFSSLKDLVLLDLSGNRISPASLDSNSEIPTNLESLYLQGCCINEFPNILKSLEKLEIVVLSDNKIEGKVPEWLWKLPRLDTMFLTNNLFDGLEGPEEVFVNSSVENLFMDQNYFEGEIPILPLSINVFVASSNRFTGSIPLSICNYRDLKFLMLSYNNLTGPIPQCLCNLTYVHLRKNNLEGSIPDGFISVLLYGHLTSLRNCSSLAFLVADHNRIKDKFPFWLKVLPNLQVLILSSNKLYGSISPPDQGPLRFPELQIFEISYNKFTGSLPPTYFVNWKASSLTMNEDGGLYMVHTDPKYINTDVTDLRYKGLSMEQKYVLNSYATIDLSGNRIEVEIPESIGLLKALIALNLSNNAFIGHIPLSFSNLGKLESLDLSSNQLSGTIPNGLGSLSFLEYINVSHNKLKGEIPQGTQITGQPKSSFEGNAGLCGLPLQETCFGTNAPPTQQPSGEEEEEEEVLNWKAVVIRYGPGVLLGLAIAQIIASYKPEWLLKLVGPNKCRSR